MSEIPTFIPPAPTAPDQPPTEYQLEKTVVGKPVNRDPVVLEDSKGNKLRAPWPPKKKCNRCYGRGFVGVNTATNELVPCRKCYPWKRG